MNLAKGISSKNGLNKRFPENVELRQYYYGEKVSQCCSGSSKRKRFNRSKADSEMDVHVKCTACPKLFKKNSEIIPHIFEHIEEDEAGNFSIRERRHPLRPSSLRCAICMKKTTMDSITGHVKNSHDMKNHAFTCRICELYYENKRELVNHMHYTHPCLDMPYSCEICGYETSFRTLIFKHFEEFHLKNYVLCNFCLMVLSVKDSEQMKFVVAHLMQHVKNSPPIKCPHCALRFTDLQNLRDHLQDNHQRHSDSTQIETIKLYKLGKGEDPILMWLPLHKNPRNKRGVPAALPTFSSQNSVQQNTTKDADSDDDLQIVYESVVTSSNPESSLENTNKEYNPENSSGTNRNRTIPNEFLDALGLRRRCDISTKSASTGTGVSKLYGTKNIIC